MNTESVLDERPLMLSTVKVYFLPSSPVAVMTIESAGYSFVMVTSLSNLITIWSR